MKHLNKLLMLTLAIPSLISCNRSKIKVLIIPKFEKGELTGDEIGEGQLYFEKYFKNQNVSKYKLANGKDFYVNNSTGVAFGITGMGKVCASSYLTTALTDNRFDFSDTYFLGVGCAGSASEFSTCGDVAIIYEAVDFDLSHYCDIRDYDKYTYESVNWYHAKGYEDSDHIVFNEQLADKVYDLVKDTKIYTTDKTRDLLMKSFQEMEWAARDPKVIKGTTVTGDCYWKGDILHEIVKEYICKEVYKCKYEYAMTEMEDIAVAHVLRDYNKLDKFIDLRVSVNIDVFFNGSNPELLWGDNPESRDPSLDIDIFDTAMQNILDVTTPIIDKILKNEL